MQYKEYNILAAKAAIMSRRRCNIMAVTANYETVMVVSLKNGEENVQKVVEKFKALIENNATLKNVDEWGKRKLAYLVNSALLVLPLSLFCIEVITQLCKLLL